VINGGLGNDTIDGRSGFDVVRMEANRADASVNAVQAGHIVQTSSAGTDTLINIERVQFNDAFLALDVGAGEIGGSAYRIYQAAFARTPDEGGLSYWIKFMDNGRSLLEVSESFLASAEFKSIYGDGPSANEFVDRLYTNVLGRAGENAGIAYWTSEITGGARSFSNVLASFSESPENIMGVQPAIADGFWYA